MQAHHLKKSRVVTRRIGRGGKRGSYSGRGIKGQRSRAGHRIRPAVRDVIKKIHKRRGFGKHRARHAPSATSEKRIAISSRLLEAKFSSGTHITLRALYEAGLIAKKRNARVKILGKGSGTKRFTFADDILLSTSARDTLSGAPQS